MTDIPDVVNQDVFGGKEKVKPKLKDGQVWYDHGEGAHPQKCQCDRCIETRKAFDCWPFKDEVTEADE